MSLLLAQRGNSTFKNENLPEICRKSDIVVAVIGRAEFVKSDWIKPGATVIDVGINRIEDSSKRVDIDLLEMWKLMLQTLQVILLRFQGE